MKKNASYPITARITLGTLLLIIGIGILCSIPFVGTRAQTSSSGTIHPTDVSALTWVGTTISPGGNTDESTCVNSFPGQSCETYTVTISGTQADWAAAGKRVQVLLTWQESTNEYDIYIHQGANTNTGIGANSGTLVTSAIQGPGLTSQVVYIDPSQPTTPPGVYTVHVAYDTTPTSAADEYHGNISAVPLTLTPPPAAPQDLGPKIGYENFEAPGVITQGTATSSGAFTVEYMGRGAGEPSVGSNWSTGVVNFQSDLETLFVTFDDSCSLANPKATWVNRKAPTSLFIDSDPIGFTDRQTHRVFAAELTLLSPDTVKISHTDDDGMTWVGDQTGGVASAVDHETIGGGPYHLPLPTGVNPIYPNTVYYCSQDIAFASCSRSDDGGSTYGGSVAMYNLTACGGLHGHVKVSPKDGTVYVPNRACGAQSAVVVSQDNGITWTVRPVQNALVSDTFASDDPAVGIDDNGRVYFLFADNGTAAGVATSDDFGATWQNIVDVGAGYSLKNIAFPAAVGGSSTGGNTGRAAVAFYGSVTGTGDSSADSFTGVWHLYVAHTFDGGLTWTTTDATPTFPMQRMGLLRGGGGPMDRNLLDFFDITIDRDGRVLVGYVNGCSGGNCSQAPVNGDGSTTVTGNTYSATATIARQSSGRRLLASKDPATPNSVPGMPFVTQRRVGPVVHLAWNEADPGFTLPNDSTISSYQILRGTAAGGEDPTPIATVAGNVNKLDDTTATDVTKTYYYKVIAVNGTGSSCANNEVAAPYVGDTCTGIIIHKNDPSHPEATGGSATTPPVGPTPSPTPTPAPNSAVPQLLIDYIAVGEPPSNPGELMFKMKVGNLSTVPPNSRWRMVWDSPASPDEQFFVGMTTDNTAPTPNVTFEYGTVATASLVVLGVPTENPVGTPDAASNFNADGTITIYVPKSAVGNPQVGDLLGAVCGRTFNSGDSPPETLERSNLLIDHTFIKGNTDNSYPPATYTVSGNNSCSVTGIVPVSAVSRKTHGNAGNFDVNLPLLGNPGIEGRSGQGANSNNHQVIVTFTTPVTLTGATATPAAGKMGSVSGAPTVSGSQVTVNLTNVSNAQTLTVNLIGVNDNMGHSGNVSIPMGVLLADVNSSRHVDAGDVGLVRQQNSQPVTLSNFREDINASGHIDAGDVGIARQQNSTGLPSQ